MIFVSYLGSRRHIPVWIAIGRSQQLDIYELFMQY